MLDWLLGNSEQLTTKTTEKIVESGFIDTANHFVLVTAISFFILIAIGRGAGGATMNLIGALFLSYLWNFWIFK